MFNFLDHLEKVLQMFHSLKTQENFECTHRLKASMNLQYHQMKTTIFLEIQLSLEFTLFLFIVFLTLFLDVFNQNHPRT